MTGLVSTGLPLELAEACKISVEIHDLNARVVGRARRRRALWLAANRKGVTYVQIAAQCGFSKQFVEKEIKTARAETKDVKLRTAVRRNRPHFIAPRQDDPEVAE